MSVYSIVSIEPHMVDGTERKLIFIGLCKDYDYAMRKHREMCSNQKYKSKIYRFIRQFGWDAFKCEIVERLPTDISEHDSLVRQQHYIDFYDSTKTMNTKNAIVTEEHKKRIRQEYRKKNADKIRQKKSDYYEANRETITEKYDLNRDKINATKRIYERKQRAWEKYLMEIHYAYSYDLFL